MDSATLKKVIDKHIQDLGLLEHENKYNNEMDLNENSLNDRFSINLSGGNKRKVNAGIAMLPGQLFWNFLQSSQRLSDKS